MTNKSILELALESLKERLKRNNNEIEIYKGNGHVSKVTCQFNSPATEDELDSFMEQFDLVLPLDYRNFLLMNDGAKLFFDPYYGGEFDLFDIDTMIHVLKNGGFPDDWLVIGYHYGQEIVIDMERVIEGRKDYLLYRGVCAPYGTANEMGLNFELWLERSIICQGVGFWDWGNFTVDEYYKARGFETK